MGAVMGIRSAQSCAAQPTDARSPATARRTISVAARRLGTGGSGMARALVAPARCARARQHEPVPASAERATDVLVVGGGVASARCARALRRGGFNGSILLVGNEPLPPYNRPPLSKELLRDELPDDLVLAEPPSWYERRNVEL